MTAQGGSGCRRTGGLARVGGVGAGGGEEDQSEVVLGVQGDTVVSDQVVADAGEFAGSQADIESYGCQRVGESIEVQVEPEHLVPEGPQVLGNTHTLDRRDQFSVEVGEGLWHVGAGAWFLLVEGAGVRLSYRFPRQGTKCPGPVCGGLRMLERLETT